MAISHFVFSLFRVSGVSKGEDVFVEEEDESGDDDDDEAESRMIVEGRLEGSFYKKGAVVRGWKVPLARTLSEFVLRHQIMCLFVLSHERD